MNIKIRPSEPEHVSCEVCLKQIPLSEAKSVEAQDYVVHFCGLECHAQWEEQKNNDKDKTE